MSGVSHNLTSVQWRHPEYLAHVGALSIHNVMDYFSESPFWDRQSTNQVLRMQTQYAVADGSLNEAEELKSGVFTLDEAG
jgi:mediator of RNA polymerase II transcription subunit 6